MELTEIRTSFIPGMSEIGTSLDHFIYNKKITVECRNRNMFGFQTLGFCSVAIKVRTQKRLKSEQICSDFRQKFLSEIGTKSVRTVGFRIFPLS